MVNDNLEINNTLQELLISHKMLIKQQNDIQNNFVQINKILFDHGKRLGDLEDFVKNFAKHVSQYFSKIDVKFVELRDGLTAEIQKVIIEVRNLGNRVLHVENSQSLLIKDMEKIQELVKDNKHFAGEVVQLEKRIVRLEKKVEVLEKGAKKK